MRLLSRFMPLGLTSGVNEVHLLWIGESLTSRNIRAENDVRLRHLPHLRVLQESY